MGEMRKAEGKTRGKKREGRFVSLEKERVSGIEGREARESSERSAEREIWYSEWRAFSRTRCLPS